VEENMRISHPSGYTFSKHVEDELFFMHLRPKNVLQLCFVVSPTFYALGNGLAEFLALSNYLITKEFAQVQHD
jgi:hypothetical protein